MSCRDKHVIAWKSFEIGDVILYTEDDVKKICSTPSSRGLVVHESIILPMLMKIPQKMKLSHLVNTMPGTFSYAQPRCILYYKLYLFCKENNRRLEFNDTVFLGHLSVLKATKPGVIGLYIQQPNSLGHPGPLCTINVQYQNCTINILVPYFNIILLQIKQQWDWTKSYHNLWTVLSLQIIHI